MILWSDDMHQRQQNYYNKLCKLLDFSPKSQVIFSPKSRTFTICFHFANCILLFAFPPQLQTAFANNTFFR